MHECNPDSDEPLLMRLEDLIKKCEADPNGFEALRALRRILAAMVTRVDAAILRPAGKGGTY